MLRIFGLLLLISCIAPAFGDDTTNQIATNLKTNLPELKVDQINPTTVPNVYEVISGRKVFYVDNTGRYAFLGNMVDLTTKQSITQAKIEQLSVVDWNQLPVSIALHQVIGKGERKIAVFTDPDCPFCKRLEIDTIPRLTNVTVYYFLFPLAIHANAESDSKRILCSETPDKTFHDWMISDTALPKRADCKAAANLATMKDIGKKVAGVEATPTIVLPNGKVMAGLIPPDYLNQLITETSPAPKAVTTSTTNPKPVASATQ